MNLQAIVNLEETIIGHILTQNTDLSTAVRHIRSEMFSDTRLAVIYTVIEKMYNAGEETDILSLKESLSKENLLETAGGNSYLIRLIDRQQTETNLKDAVRLLKVTYLKRKLATALSGIITKAKGETEPLEKLLAEVNLLTEDIANESLSAPHCTTMPPLMEKAIAKIENQLSLTGIPTGFPELDKLTSGWHPGELILLAAHPSTGKTTMALHIAKTAAKAGYATIVYSPDMPGEQLADRWLQSELPADTNRKTTVSKSEIEKAYAVARHLSELPLYVNDSANIDTAQIYSSALIMQSKGKCNFIVIDSVQQCEADTDFYRQDREQETEQIIRKMKAIAMELQIPVVLVSQLRRKPEQASLAKPCLADLQESVEQHADIVILLHHSPSAKANGNLIIAKHRNGETKEIPFNYYD